MKRVVPVEMLPRLLGVAAVWTIYFADHMWRAVPGGQPDAGIGPTGLAVVLTFVLLFAGR